MISRIYVGSDISKNWFDVRALVGKEELIFRFSNDVVGIPRFIEQMRSIESRKVHVCMEYTGGYETPLAMACLEAGFIVSIVDGAKIAHYRRSFSSTGASTDLKSAYLLARYCKERKPEQWYPVPDEYRKLRELVRHRERLLESKGGWECRAAYGVEDELVHAQRQALVETHRLMVKAIEERIAEHVKAHENLAAQIKLLISIPGIAYKSAYRILAEVGPIANYQCAKQLALAAGLVPIVVHSGQKVPPGKLPVYGNKELRNALFYPALVSKRSVKGVGAFMKRLSDGEKAKMTVVAAGMRKIIHIVFGVLTHQMPYQEEIATQSS